MYKNDYLNNVDKIHAVINEIVDNIILPQEQDVYSYFLHGHCNIFINILDNIFQDDISFYYNESTNHIIGKIGNNFYDVRGYLNTSELDGYTYIEKDYFYYLVDIHLIGNYDKTYDESIINIGTNFGKNKWQDGSDYNMKRSLKKEND